MWLVVCFLVFRSWFLGPLLMQVGVVKITSPVGHGAK